MLVKLAPPMLPLIVCLIHFWPLWLVVVCRENHLAPPPRPRPTALPPRPHLPPLLPPPRPFFFQQGFFASLSCGHSFL